MSLRRLLYFSALFLALSIPTLAATPGVGDKAPDFTLSAPDGGSIQLSSLTAKGRVVLVVLRGYPGFQCPYCQKQFHDFELSAAQFAAVNTQVLFLYPGEASSLAAHASDFLGKQPPPAGFQLVLDPDFVVTNQYGLRWNAPNETAYPSTFIIEKNGTVYSASFSKGHGGRATASDTLAALSADTTAPKN